MNPILWAFPVAGAALGAYWGIAWWQLVVVAFTGSVVPWAWGYTGGFRSGVEATANWLMAQSRANALESLSRAREESRNADEDAN